ncbi:MAG TPA: radical SAM protein [Dissulfurispiraceae bacterium]|nr:radical SAM protein [Dissulfurispiraceae bacterium]
MANRIGNIELPINRLHMELTNICNFSCEFCPDSKMKRRRGMMSAETARAILDDAGRNNIARTVLFHVMGEPTLHPNLVDIVGYAGSRGIGTCLTTNGSRLNLDLLNELSKVGLDRIIISLQTPDDKTFALRGTRELAFSDYAARILEIARQFIDPGKTKLTISFLSSPLRRLIIPIYPEVSIADTSSDLKMHLRTWADMIMEGTSIEKRRDDIVKQIRKIHSFRENVIRLTDRLFFHTRIMGDWSVHFDRKNVNAAFGYCPALRDNFGILWNGDYTFCCTDYDAGTTAGNFGSMSLTQYLESEAVQRTVQSFSRFRVLQPHCRQCLGDRNVLNAIVKQMGSICYFKFIRRTP